MTAEEWCEFQNSRDDRKRCPVCDEPVVCRMREDRSVYIDLDHKEGCRFLDLTDEYERIRHTIKDEEAHKKWWARARFEWKMDL